MAHYTLWLIITCLPTQYGCTTLLHSTPVFRPLATYASASECAAAKQSFFAQTTTDKKTGSFGWPFCLPTGLTDPLRTRFRTR